MLDTCRAFRLWLPGFTSMTAPSLSDLSTWSMHKIRLVWAASFSSDTTASSIHCFWVFSRLTPNRVFNPNIVKTLTSSLYLVSPFCLSFSSLFSWQTATISQRADCRRGLALEAFIILWFNHLDYFQLAWTPHFPAWSNSISSHLGADRMRPEIICSVL